MPAILPPAKVLVTGANGFLGMHIVKKLIERGYTVRGAVRSASKGDYIASVFGTDRFEYCIVPDMEAPGAYDDAVKGVDAIEHTAAVIKDAKPGGDPNGEFNQCCSFGIF